MSFLKTPTLCQITYPRGRPPLRISFLNTLAIPEPASDRALNNYSLNRIPFPRGCHWNNHWHKHDKDDEFFFVLEGHFVIDLEGRSVDLQRHEGFVVPRGVLHRTRAPDRAVILMVETAAIVPTGDA